MKALTEYIKKHGSIQAVRVSSAHARGNARKYSYWGVARYQITLNANGYPSARCLRAAPSTRRVQRLAEQDAKGTGLLVIRSIGRLSESDADNILVAVLSA